MHFLNDLFILAKLNFQIPSDTGFRECARYLEEHYAQEISLAILAERSGFTKQGVAI